MFFLCPEKSLLNLQRRRTIYLCGSQKKGDSREIVLSKLEAGGFLQIYEEREKGLVRCTIKWGEKRYQLVCKIVDDKLKLCLIEGQRGWQDFFYDDVVRPQWKELREKISKSYGQLRKRHPFHPLMKFLWTTWGDSLLTLGN